MTPDIQYTRLVKKDYCNDSCGYNVTLFSHLQLLVFYKERNWGQSPTVTSLWCSLGNTNDSGEAVTSLCVHVGFLWVCWFPPMPYKNTLVCGLATLNCPRCECVCMGGLVSPPVFLARLQIQHYPDQDKAKLKMNECMSGGGKRYNHSVYCILIFMKGC